MGIGHLASLGKYLLVNNIDHNSEISLLEQSSLKPISLCNQTIYPDDPENAGFDLDIHAAFFDSSQKSLMMLNHFGRLVFFDAQPLSMAEETCLLNTKAEILWISDSEYSLLVNDCLISSSPGNYHVTGPAKTGLFISSPLSKLDLNANQTSNNIKQLDYKVYFAEMGNVSAIAFNHNQDLLALAFAQRLVLVKVNRQENGTLSLTDIVAEFTVPFHCRYLSFYKERYLVCAGHNVAFVDDVYNPENLKGGGFVVIDINNNQILSSIAFNEDLAWGNGGQCVTLLDQNLFSNSAASKDIDELLIVGIDRLANLWAWNWRQNKAHNLVSAKQNGNYSSYGIAHLAWHEKQLFCGFNRDGARLHMYSFAPL